MNGELSVQVKAKQWEADDGPEDWYLAFKVKSGPLAAKFTVHEPYCSSWQEWLYVAEGRRGIGLYSGSGGCVSAFDIRGDLFVFENTLSGMGCGTDGEIAVPLAAVTGPLKAALESAREKGLKFASEDARHRA